MYLIDPLLNLFFFLLSAATSLLLPPVPPPFAYQNNIKEAFGYLDRFLALCIFVPLEPDGANAGKKPSSILSLVACI